MDDTHHSLGLATNCHHNDDMADWQRLGQQVTARRVALGYRRREDLTNAADGVSLRTLGDIESGRRTGYHRNTLATLENALRWAPGSIQAILEGGEFAEQPTPATIGSGPDRDTAPTSPPSSAGDSALIKIMRSKDLTDDQKARIIRELIAEQQRYAERRADELIRQVRDERG